MLITLRALRVKIPTEKATRHARTRNVTNIVACVVKKKKINKMKGNLRRFIGRLESCITPWKIFYGVTVKKKVTEQYFPVVIFIFYGG